MNRLETYASQHTSDENDAMPKKKQHVTAARRNNDEKEKLTAFLPQFKKAIDASNADVVSAGSAKIITRNGSSVISVQLVPGIVKLNGLSRVHDKIAAYIKKAKFKGNLFMWVSSGGVFYICVECA